MFQHTATRKWPLSSIIVPISHKLVSTHSHPKVAAKSDPIVPSIKGVSTHSHPKVAAGFDGTEILDNAVSTHSHPKVAAFIIYYGVSRFVRFNTQPPESGRSLHKKVRKISKLNTVFR